MRSIDADAIYDTLSDIFIEYLATSSNTDTRNALDSLYHTVLSAVETAPTVSPDEVRDVGKWEMREDYYGSNVYKCSVCGSDWDMIEGTPQDNDFKYCPNCGARMTEVSE